MLSRQAKKLAMSLGLIAGLSPVAGFAAERPVVVELFTSQGCSSCPPANAYLNEMAQRPPRRAAARVSRHLLGPAGLEGPVSRWTEATERQDRYGHRFGDGSYTPESWSTALPAMSARTARKWDRRSNRPSATAGRRPRSASPKAGDQLTIDVGGGSGNAKVLLIGFDHDHETAIRRGENGGRTLEEANVVARSARSAIGRDALRVSEQFPDGQDAAVILEAPDGRIVGASRLATGGST